MACIRLRRRFFFAKGIKPLQHPHYCGDDHFPLRAVGIPASFKPAGGA